MLESVGVPYDVDALIASSRHRADFDSRTCRARVLLNLLKHSPEVASHPDIVADEVSRASAWCVAQIGQEAHRLRVVSAAALEQSTFATIEPETAERVISSFHFLGYARSSSQNFALMFPSGLLGAVASFSPFDLHYLSDLIPNGFSAEGVLVLNRLYSFPWTPPNTLSFLLGRTFAHLRSRYRLIVTYCNPNAGHRGSLYAATNWTLIARQRERPYCYLDGDYVSRRQVMRLPGDQHGRITESRQPLRDMLIFAQPLGRHAARALRTATPPPTIIAPGPTQLVEE